MIRTKRSYEEPAKSDGARYLVDGLRPRGVKKETLKAQGWLKDVAPSDTLRHWFNHDPAKWDQFREGYFRELDRKPEAWSPLVDAAKRGTITLIYSARDAGHNNAIALAEYLRTQIAKSERQ